MGWGRAARGWLIAYVVVALVHLGAVLVHRPLVALITVALCMPTLMGFLLTTRHSRDRLAKLAAVALVFSWCGDVFGSSILVKIAFFLVAQLCYVAAFWPYRARSALRRHRSVVALYGVVVLAIIVVVAPPAGPLAPAVVVYAVVIGAMAVLATGITRPTAVGAVVFIASDTLIAVTTFVLPGRVPLDTFLIMASYLVAQLLIIVGVAGAPGQQADSVSRHADTTTRTLHRF